MNRSIYLVVAGAVVLIGLQNCGDACAGQSQVSQLPTTARRIRVDEYVDKMKAGWIGQMAGVGWAAPTEFQWQGEIIPGDKVPQWEPSMINQFGQDDLYVEMTFLRTLELHGFGVCIRQAGIDFANSRYGLWHANVAGRNNLRAGIAPPDSGHPKFNKCADDIDYQIEADFAGLITPGMPNVAIQLGETFGRLMNYGDGLYAGQFVSGMYTEAFFETDILKIIEAGLQCIPPESQYYEAICDVIRWHSQYPNDWKRTWHLIDAKYHRNPDYRRFSCSGPRSDFNIDAKINGALIVLGLLYGEGDLDQTIIISMRGGHDSDCNPSNAAGVLATTIGFKNLPEKYTKGLDPTGKFSHTPYTFPMLIDVCTQLARDAVVNLTGGRIEIDDQGNEYFVIPRQRPRPSPLERSWDPNPPKGVRFTEEEMAQITAGISQVRKALERFAAGWTVDQCGDHMDPGLHEELRGRKNVFVTHPLSRSVGCVLSRTVSVPPGRKSVLRLSVGHHPSGDWDLIVRADGEQLLRKNIGADVTDMGWIDVEVDLSRFAGRSVELELVNEPTGWHFEGAYWSEILVQKD